MSEFKLERNMFDKKSYYYMSRKDSLLYDKVKDSKDKKDITIKKLLLDKAKQSHLEHCMSTY
jgi:hypothetical protein